MRINLSTEINKTNRKREVRNMKIHWAVYYYYHVSKSDRKIAKSIGVSVRKLREWRKCHAAVFENAKMFWHPDYYGDASSLKLASRIWTAMIHDGLDLFPSENAVDRFMEKNGLSTEANTAENQIGLGEPLTPPAPPRRFKLWIHDLTTAIFAIGLLIG